MTTQVDGRVAADYRPPRRHLAYLSDSESDALVDCGEREAFDRLDALDRERIERAREDFLAFCEYVATDESTGQPLEVQWYQEDWFEALQKHKRVLIIAPRNHGKTVFIILYVLWRIGRDPNLLVKIACASGPKAEERLSEIRQNIKMNERLQSVFPNLSRVSLEVDTTHKVTLKRSIRAKDATIEAAGIAGSNVTGGRADLLVVDDGVDGSTAFSEAERKRVKRTYYSVWVNMLAPDGQVVVICTLWHRDDLNHELRANEEYHTIENSIDDDFSSIWPARWPESALRARCREIDTIEFNRGYRNRAQDESTAPIKSDWIQYVDASQVPPVGEMSFFLSYDPAKSQGDGSDYTAEVVIAVHQPTKKIYVVDARHGRPTRDEQSRWIWDRYQRFRPERIFIEDIGNDLCMWCEKDHPELRGIVEPVKPKISKYHRLMAVTPLLERGNVLFLSHLAPNRANIGVGRGSLVDELLDFPIATHDDLVDSWSQAIEGARYYALDGMRDWGGIVTGKVTVG